MEANLSSDLLRGHTDAIVLRILSTGDAYGFEIYNRIREKTGELYELKETTLYSSYKRLEAEGAVLSYWGDETQGARRKYYRITSKGQLLLEKSMKDWKFTQKILTSLMEEAAELEESAKPEEQEKPKTQSKQKNKEKQKK
jgi:DNA-binding PadR family transcriptional regulator